MITAAFLTFVGAAVLGNLGSQSPHYAGLIACVGWFFICRALPDRGWQWLLTIALWVSLAVAALAAVQVALWMPRARGPFVSPNFLGAYAVLMVFVAVAAGRTRSVVPQGAECNGGAEIQTVASIRHWNRTTALSANFISIALSQSRGALVALAAGLVVMLPKKAAAAAIAAALIAAAFLIRSGNEESRLGIWLLGLQAGMLRPLTGWGIGGLSVDGLDRFYSIPIEWFTNAGILGVLAGTWLLIAACYIASRPQLVSPASDRVPPHVSDDSFGHPVEGAPRVIDQIRLPERHAILAFLAAWFVQGLFLGGTPATNLLLVTVLAWLASVRRNVSDGPRRVDDDQPLLDRRMRADGA